MSAPKASKHLLIGAALLLALALVIPLAGGGCGASSQQAGGSGGQMAGSGGASASGGATNVGCRVDVTAVIPMEFSSWQAGPSAVVRLRARILDGSPGSTATWKWSARFADGSPLTTTTALGDPALVDVVTAQAGSYFIEADFAPSPQACHKAFGFTVKTPRAAVASYRFRVTPPPGSGEPAQVIGPLLVTGRTPTSLNNLPLVPTTVITLAPLRAEDSQALAAYVRTEETRTGVIQEGRATETAGATFRLAAGRYRVLVVPDDNTRAPWLSPETDLAQLGSLPLVIDQGSALAGKISDQNGQPLAKVAVTLRAGSLPSTLARTDAQGGFTLRIRPGTHAVALAQDDGPVHWEGAIGQANGIAFDKADSTDGKLDLRVRVGARRALQLNSQAGKTPGIAMVSAPALSEGFVSATLSSTAHPALPSRAGTGLVRAQASFIGTPARAIVAGLPPALYRVTVLPSGTDQAITSLAPLDATAGDVSAEVTMKSPVTMSGAWNGDVPPGGLIVAIDDEAAAWWSAGVPQSLTGAVDQGRWALQVNPLRRYRLIAVPSLPDGLEGGVIRVVLPSVSVQALDLTVPALELPPRVLFGGSVVDPLLQPMTGALVQAFCLEGAPRCEDPSVPLAEATTHTDGHFSLSLPDPGLLETSQP